VGQGLPCGQTIVHYWLGHQGNLLVQRSMNPHVEGRWERAQIALCRERFQLLKYPELSRLPAVFP
jgi:hypothetical protein